MTKEQEEDYKKNRGVYIEYSEQLNLDELLTGDLNTLINRVVDLVSKTLEEKPELSKAIITREDHYADEQCFMIAYYMYETYGRYEARLKRELEAKEKAFITTKNAIENLPFLSDEKKTEIIKLIIESQELSKHDKI